MKIKKEHYAKIKQQIKTAVISALENSEGSKTFADWQEYYMEQGLSQKRFRWDLWYIGGSYRTTDFIYELYDYVNDTHIDTALKRIVKELSWEL